MKKRFAATTSIAFITLALGYLLAVSLLIGFLTSKYLSGKTTGERGKIGSVRIPFKRWRIHLHHWLYSLALIAIFAATDFQLLTPGLTYGFLCGVTIQGVYCYEDWHRILVDRHPVAVEQTGEVFQGIAE
jgi:hypothetical protein